jgi:hypothetical protein
VRCGPLERAPVRHDAGNGVLGATDLRHHCFLLVVHVVTRARADVGLVADGIDFVADALPRLV